MFFWESGRGDSGEKVPAHKSARVVRLMKKAHITKKNCHQCLITRNQNQNQGRDWPPLMTIQ